MERFFNFLEDLVAADDGDCIGEGEDMMFRLASRASLRAAGSIDPGATAEAPTSGEEVTCNDLLADFGVGFNGEDGSSCSDLRELLWPGGGTAMISRTLISRTFCCLS